VTPSIRFERGAGVPPAPVPIARSAGHLYYCRYPLGGAWESWAPPGVLARWSRVTRTALQVKGGYVQISPCDDRCQAGEVIIQPDAHGPFPEISGELLAHRQIPL
jgi:hypothetical protein